jgi:8-oxo-dGTP pyrophosphatase MutT (NUDIX family)
VEPGESPAEACLREIKEELGLTAELGKLLVVDWAPHPSEGDKLLFIFDAGFAAQAELEAMTPDGIEISEIQFRSSEWLTGRMPDRLERRLRLAILAAQSGECLYADHGVKRP